ncbi:MAG: hypothetical protein ACKV2T_18045, partial [Kofleriaceae bacterium]
NRAGEVFGTPEYMAPELISCAADAQPSSEIYAFGVIASELLAGIDLPRLIRRCLELDPSQRPSATDLVNALK